MGCKSAMMARWTAWVACLSALVAGGCVSTSSLKRPADWGAVVVPQSAVLALGAIRDSVPCDDEALYLQRHIQQRGVFYDCFLADPDPDGAVEESDIVVSGSLTPELRAARHLGWGVFATIITCGGYYLLGGPTREEETIVHYRFDVEYRDRGQTRRYDYSDHRKVRRGLYAPALEMRRKPELYSAGWDELLYRICRDNGPRGAGSVAP